MQLLTNWVFSAVGRVNYNLLRQVVETLGLVAPLQVIPPAEIAKLGSIHFPSLLMKVLNLQLLTGCSSCDEDLADDYDYNWGGKIDTCLSF